jgi:hypothetical protein
VIRAGQAEVFSFRKEFFSAKGTVGTLTFDFEDVRDFENGEPSP